jgi:peptidoglycan/xylan/chitin deacetylase (PgdA/CDA1 family)
MFCYICDWVYRQALRMIGRKPDASCVILYYHSVPDKHRRNFAQQMDVVLRLTQPISIGRPPKLLPGERYSAITFDDGFENIIDNAIPALLQREIPATIFLTTAYLGQHADWWPKSSTEYRDRIAPAEKWQRLRSDMISFGSHTITHPYLSRLGEIDARRELIESRVKLQEILDREIIAFSFPYGDYNADLVGWCREAGYQHVFTTMPFKAFRNKGEYESGRVKVEPTDWKLEFHMKVLGAYRWLPYAITLKRKLIFYIFKQGSMNKNDNGMRNTVKKEIT